MTQTTNTFRACTDTLTVYVTDAHGETFDLNAYGERCATVTDLAAFVAELCEQGFYDADQRDALLASVAA